MIKRIIRLQNVGLMRDACAAKAVELGPVTAIYAENGRGKSTLATVLRAAHLADIGRLEARRTIDSPDQPEVQLLLPDGNQVRFDGATWSGTPPDVVVFDSEFVEHNVYSGFEVRPEQRQSLLEFALGEHTVQLKQEVELLSQAIRAETTKRTDAEHILEGVARPYSIADFISLQPVPDSDERISALRKRIEAAKNEKQLNARKSPAPLQAFTFDAGAAFDTLHRELADVEDSAEETVRSHLDGHTAADLESWLNAGQAYIQGEVCPFCNQDTNGVSLIRAYRSYFNQGYADLKRDVDALADLVGNALATSHIDALVASAETNASRIAAWTDQFELSIPTTDLSELYSLVDGMRESVVGFVIAKKQQPLARISTDEDRRNTEATLAEINSRITAYNTEVTISGEAIHKFKEELATEDVVALENEVHKLEAAIRRQLPEITTAAQTYQTATAEKKRLEAEKTKVRKQIDGLMATTLQQYQTSINQLLTSFGAEFSIEQLKPSYVGSGEPRTEYGLLLRNQSVKLGARSDLTSSRGFASALSEADKRTLAFAFFVARLQADPSLSKRIVVLDDPVSSMDRGRRHNTIRIIADMAGKCSQAIILSHDAYFVRDLRERLSQAKPQGIPCVVLGIHRTQDGYSALAGCDIDEICSSDYFRHHRIVADYVNGSSAINSRDVAKAIRPLLEGYYHRRFPGAIPKRVMFGQIIAIAVDPATSTPLVNLRPLATELAEVNDYAAQFHHDTNQSADSVPVIESELLGFARRALDLIYQNG